MSTSEYHVQDKRLLDWSERAIAHQVVFETRVLKNLNEGGWKSRLFLRHILTTEVGKQTDTSVLKHSEALMIEFGAMGRKCSAVLFSEIATVALFVDISDEEVELIGFHDPDGFWQYLDSFPNWYKFMTSNCPRAAYWRNR
ncbi:MAG: hypothetical protein CSA50_07050 [Gammaproteobacteria bacterium]|nr:MAG: hypothetical protein CSA50_07050 [Gammaproteobacteria bacterium]